MPESEENVIGASVLPYARDPCHGNVYFLLGRERPDLRYEDSNTWGDLSGRTGINHWGSLERPEETAAREAWEETAAVVRFQRGDDLPVASPANLQAQLDGGRYAMKMTFYSRLDKPQYVTYLMEIPFDPSVPDRFHRVSQILRMGSRDSRVNRTMVRNSLQGLLGSETHPALRTSGCSVFLEKAALKWFGMPMVEKAALRDDGMLVNRLDGCQYLRPTFLNRLRAILTEMTSGRLRFHHVAYHMEAKDPHWFQDEASDADDRRADERHDAGD